MDPTTQTQSRQVSQQMVIIFRMLNYLEVVALLTTVIGLLMLYSSIGGALEILMVSMSVLAGTFFLRGYQPPTPEQTDGTQKPGFVDLLALVILPKAGWIACSVSVIGILFSTLGLKGSTEMLMIGCATLTIALLLIGIMILMKPSRSARLMPLLYRAIPLWPIGVYLLMKAPVS